MQGVQIDGWFRGIEMNQAFLLIQRMKVSNVSGINATLDVYASAQHKADGEQAINKVTLNIPYEAEDPYEVVYESILTEYPDATMVDIPTPTPPHTPELRVEDLPIPPPGIEQRAINLPDRFNRITKRKNANKP